jgi:uncharacterized protein YbjT (DUF2867 family)
MIVVFGATGAIGRHVVHALAGGKIRAVVRARERGEALGVPYVVADLDDPATLAPALAGAERVFLNGPVDEHMARQQIAAIDAARAAGVTRIVRLSAAGASTASARPLNRWHGEIDDHLARSGVAAALLRPTFFTQNLLNSAASVHAEGRLYGGFGAGRLAFIDGRDIAACAAALLTADRPAHGAFVLTGRETLSFADVAAKLSAKLGRAVAYVDRPVADVVAAMKRRGMAPSIADSFGQMMQSFAAGGAAAITPTVEAITGRAPRTVDDFLDDHLDAFR